MFDSPIFIVGTERSGSNLLRLILNAHSRITVPHPPHIVRYFAPLEPSYGDLSVDANFGRLVDDILKLVRVHIFPWEVTVDRDRVMRDAKPRNSFGVFVALYQQYLAHTGKARWGCKSTFLIDHTDAILDRFPAAALILLVRDPRDVAVSSRKSVFSPCHPYFTAQLWRVQQEAGLDLAQRLPPENFVLLRYEDLLADPETTVAQLCGSLDEEFEPAMLRFFESDEAKKSGALSDSWRNTAGPILSKNVGKYREGLTDAELELVEGVCGELMCKLDYPTETPAARVKLSKMALWRFELLNGWWRTGVELDSLFSDRNHWRRWSRELLLGYLGARAKVSRLRRHDP